MQHSAFGCNTLGCVTLVLRRGRCPGGQQWWRRCRRGMDSVAVQMRTGDGLFRGAEVGKGSTQSRCRCGRRVDSAAVASDERSPKMHMRAYRGEPYQAALRCARAQHVHETCLPSGRKPRVHRATTIVPQVCPTRHSVRRRSARKDPTANCGLSQPSVALRRQPQRMAMASSRQLAVTAPGCNRWRCVATDCAALQQMPLRATAGGAMQRAVHCCRLRCDATSSACPVGPTLGVL